MNPGMNPGIPRAAMDRSTGSNPPWNDQACDGRNLGSHTHSAVALVPTSPTPATTRGRTRCVPLVIRASGRPGRDPSGGRTDEASRAPQEGALPAPRDEVGGNPQGAWREAGLIHLYLVPIRHRTGRDHETGLRRCPVGHALRAELPTRPSSEPAEALRSHTTRRCVAPRTTTRFRPCP